MVSQGPGSSESGRCCFQQRTHLGARNIPGSTPDATSAPRSLHPRYRYACRSYNHLRHDVSGNKTSSPRASLVTAIIGAQDFRPRISIYISPPEQRPWHPLHPPRSAVSTPGCQSKINPLFIMALKGPKYFQKHGVANRLEKRALLIAVNLVAGLSIFFFGTNGSKLVNRRPD